MTHTPVVSRTKNALVAGLFVLATVILPFSSVQNASAATLTWDGSAGDGLFSTAANWSTDTVPVDGDVIVFEPLVGGPLFETISLTNDLVNVEFAGVAVGLSDSANPKNYEVDILSLASPVISTIGSGSSAATFAVTDSLQVSGDLNIPANTYFGFSGTADVDITGNLVIAGGSSIGLGSGSSIGGSIQTSNPINAQPSLTIGGTFSNVANSFGSLNFDSPSATIPLNITANENEYATLSFTNCNNTVGGASVGPQAVSCTPRAATFTLTGTITLNANMKISIGQNSIVNITGTVVSNGYSITPSQNSLGTLNVSGQTVDVPVVEKQLTGDAPSTNVTLLNKEVGIISGVRGTVFVSQGGTLKGTGTVTTLSVDGVVRPGNSPGTITVLSSVAFGSQGTLEMELLNADTYDQLIVGEDYSGGGNAVSLNGTLSTILFDGWAVQQGDAFIIIDNRSSTAVSGTFTGLSEGTQFVVDGITFSISYVGGDGNDVVLTAINSGTDPDAPNTGIAAFVTANPAIVAAAGLVGIMTLIIVSKVVARQRA